MPEFIAEHVPAGLDEFTTGYLEAVEWLLDEDVDRAALTGFSRPALVLSKAACKAFQRDNAADLATFCAAPGLTLHTAGVDFWLTRNGHGAGYWDRGKGATFDRLTDAARAFGEVDTYIHRRRIYCN